MKLRLLYDPNELYMAAAFSFTCWHCNRTHMSDQNTHVDDRREPRYYCGECSKLMEQG